MACGDQAVESRDVRRSSFGTPLRTPAWSRRTWTPNQLADLADLRHRLSHVHFDHLIELADRQRAKLEAWRAHAGRQALDPAGPST